MTDDRRRAGFSLIELLTALAILGIVTTLGFTMFSRVNDLWRDLTVRTELDNRIERAFDKMRGDFAEVLSAKLSGVSLRGVSQETRARGVSLDDDRIVFPIEGVFGPEGRDQAVNVMYRIERQPEQELQQGRLVRTLGGLLSETPQGTPTTMAEGAVGLRIEYLNPAGEWVQSWSESALPRALRVSIALVDPDFPENQVSRKAVFPINTE